MNKIFLIIVGFIWTVFFSVNCGYSISSNPSFSTSLNDQQIYLEVFQNFTHPYKPGLDIELHKQVSQELMQSAYELTTDINKADAIVSGQIVDYKQTVLSTSPDQTPTEIQVAIKIKLKIADRSGAEKNYIVNHRPEPFAVVIGEKLEDAEKRMIRKTAEQIILTIAGVTD